MTQLVQHLKNDDPWIEYRNARTDVHTASCTHKPEMCRDGDGGGGGGWPHIYPIPVLTFIHPIDKHSNWGPEHDSQKMKSQLIGEQ